MDQMIEALELYTGEFLADFGEEEWVQAERAQLEKSIFRCTERSK